MGYYIDLKTKSLEEYQKKLAHSRLIPSQQILKEQMQERFQCLQKHQLNHLFDIQQQLKTKDRVAKFAKQSGLPEKYLATLAREINSYHTRPRNIKDYPCLSQAVIGKLEQIGIKKTPQLYERIVTREERQKLSREIEITEEEVLLLAKLTDMTRIRYVNPDFAALMAHSDYDTIAKVKTARHEELHAHLHQLNQDNKYYKAKIGLNDMLYFIGDANFISSQVEF